MALGGQDDVAPTLLRPHLPRRKRGGGWGEGGGSASPGNGTGKKNDPVRRWGKRANFRAQEERAAVACAACATGTAPERRAPAGPRRSVVRPAYVTSHDIRRHGPDDGNRAVSNTSKPFIAKNLLR